jgi:hypothetical protein
MDHLALEVAGETRPLRRGRTVVAIGNVFARLVANSMLAAALIALGWGLAVGVAPSLHL